MHKQKNKNNKQIIAFVKILEAHNSDAALKALHLAPWQKRPSFFGGKTKKHAHPQPEQMAHAIAALGPGFVELVRMLSGRGDLLPFHYRRAFSRATYAVPVLSKKELLSHIRAQLNTHPNTVFDHIDPQPYQTHMFGASYKAFLRGSQRGVLITIQDMRAMLALLRNMEAIHTYLDYTRAQGIKNALWADIWAELSARVQVVRDATHVAGRMTMLHAQFEKHAKINVPEVLWEYTTPHMLVTEYTSLPTLADVARGSIKGLAKTYAARYVVEMAMHMYGIGGTFLLRPQLSDILIGEKNALVLANCVATGVLEPRDRRLFIALMYALAQKNYTAASRILLDAHFAHAEHGKKMHAGVVWPEVSSESLADTLWEFLEAAFRDGIHIPLGISMAAESFYNIERLTTSVYPDVDMQSACRDGIKKYISEIFGVPKTSSMEKIISTLSSK